jgi:hypothetical protein
VIRRRTVMVVTVRTRRDSLPAPEEEAFVSTINTKTRAARPPFIALVLLLRLDLRAGAGVRIEPRENVLDAPCRERNP